MKREHLFSFSKLVLWMWLIIHPMVLANEMATKKFEMAIAVCERGLQMTMPKSKGALIVLQSLFKKYQRHRDSALEMDENLKKSESKYTKSEYTATLFGNKTFGEIYQICEHDLPERLTEASAIVDEKMKKIEEAQAKSNTEIQSLIQQHNAASKEAITAIDKYCANHLLNPTAEDATVYDNYRQAKQKSLQRYPDIVTQFHTATLVNTSNGKPETTNKTIQAWFDYCDTIFTQGSLKTITETNNTDNLVTATPISDTEGPPPLPATDLSKLDIVTKTSATTASTTTSAPATATVETAEKSADTTAVLPDVLPSSEEVKNSTVETKTVSTSVTTEKTEAETELEGGPPVAAGPPITGTPPSLSSATTVTKETSDLEESATPTTSVPTSVATANDTGDIGNPGHSDNPDSQEINQAEVEAEDETAEYKSLLSKVQGDRLKILKEEGRLPDFVDDEDYNYQKAKIWQYEKANGSKCNMYTFKNNQLAKTQKNLRGQCPPLSQD